MNPVTQYLSHEDIRATEWNDEGVRIAYDGGTARALTWAQLVRESGGTVADIVAHLEARASEIRGTSIPGGQNLAASETTTAVIGGIAAARAADLADEMETIASGLERGCAICDWYGAGPSVGAVSIPWDASRDGARRRAVYACTDCAAESVTLDDIAKLRREARAAGDEEQVRLCDVATGGARHARAACAEVILAARARREED